MYLCLYAGVMAMDVCTYFYVRQQADTCVLQRTTAPSTAAHQQILQQTRLDAGGGAGAHRRPAAPDSVGN